MKVGTSLMLTLVSAVDFLLFVRSFLGGGGVLFSVILLLMFEWVNIAL